MIQFGENWFLTQTAPDIYLKPSDLQAPDLDWVPACVPGTVAQSLRSEGHWAPGDEFDFDHYDFWYRQSFSLGALDDSEPLPILLHFDGLATLCEVWFNGQRILESNNMFLSYALDISEYVKPTNELYLCFRSLNNALSRRFPRPRWKTKLVGEQKLRNFRTTLLGRIPGWAPSIAAVGPWKPIFLSMGISPVNTSLLSYMEGDEGVVNFSCDVRHAVNDSMDLVLSVGEHTTKLKQEKIEGGSRFYSVLRIDEVECWWPHTHGKPALYTARLSINAAGEEVTHTLPSVGFKNVCVNRTNNEFSVAVNDVNVFCRGACWTVNDVVSLVGDEASLEQTLTLMRDAGANMIRVGGTMVYEQEAFYRLCDEMGIMVWQDFMFANMDYPVHDENFSSSIHAEAQQVLSRLRQHVCTTVYCGNSEIEQQAAMLGMAADEWTNEFFSEQLPRLCSELHPGIPYVSSTPSGGVLPFHTDQGVTHYYGVGAYLRSVEEVRRHNVKFTPECLGFANIPAAKTRNAVLEGKQIPIVHHPRWKSRTPRDTGTGWDFEDVRDHYLSKLFGINSTQLRSYDNEKYLALSEIVSGEMMSQVFSEWRSVHSQCSGALVWFLKDLLPGAGWGIIDSHGLPKACYYYLKRRWQAVGISITDESLNGLHIHLYNENSDRFHGEIELGLLNELSVTIANVTSGVVVDGRSTALFSLDQLLNGFYDLAYSYRFGPSKHSVIAARLKDEKGKEVSSAFYFPNAELPRLEDSPNLATQMVEINREAGIYQLQLSSDKFLYAVNVDIPGYLPDDNYFHMTPGTPKVLNISARSKQGKQPKGYVSAINMYEDVRIKVAAE